MEFKIRRAVIEDLENCMNVIRRAFGTVAEDFGLNKDNCPTNPAFIELKHLQQNYNNGNLMYKLVSNDEIYGFMQLENGGDGIYHLKNVAVVPELRHMGLGTDLLEFAKTKVKKLGGKTIKIGIIEENTELKKWYIKNGFVHTGKKEFDHLPFTVGFMQAVIKS